MSQEPGEYDWSNAETKTIAYYLYEFEEEALEEISDIDYFFDFLSEEDRERFLTEINSLMLSGMDPGFDPDMGFGERLEAFFPGARVKHGAGRLKELFENRGLGVASILWEAGILIGASLKYQEGESGASVNKEDPIWEEELSDRDFGLLLELFLLSLDRVNWEEIVSVWLESQADKEEPEE